MTQTAYFGMGLTLELPDRCAIECSGPGRKDNLVEYWTKELENTPQFQAITDEVLIAELREYGAWTPDELHSRHANIRRIIWLGANDVRDTERGG